MLPLSLPVLPSPARAGCEHCWPCEELPGVPSAALASSPSQGHTPGAAASHGLRARCCCVQWSPCLYPRLGDMSHPLTPGCDPFGAQCFSPPAFPDPTTPGHVPPASVRSHIPRTGPWGFMVCCRILQAAGPWPSVAGVGRGGTELVLTRNFPRQPFGRAGGEGTAARAGRAHARAHVLKSSLGARCLRGRG